MGGEDFEESSFTLENDDMETVFEIPEIGLDTYVYCVNDEDVYVSDGSNGLIYHFYI